MKSTKIVSRWMLTGYNLFGISYRLSGFFDKVIKLLRARGIQATSPRLHSFVKNIFSIDVVEQSSRGPKQSQVFFVHIFPLCHIIPEDYLVLKNPALWATSDFNGFGGRHVQRFWSTGVLEKLKAKDSTLKGCCITSTTPSDSSAKARLRKTPWGEAQSLVLLAEIYS